MKLVIAIFGLLSTLSAQIICRPVDAKGNVEAASFNSWKIASTKSDLSSNTHFFADYSSRPVRCFELLHGTLSVNSVEIVHDFWVEIKPFERWMSDSAFCSSSRSKLPLFSFSQGLTKQSGQETPERKQPMLIPAEFCQATDH
jgi:hypothetical protein